jgi:hypothetical protein
MKEPRLGAGAFCFEDNGELALSALLSGLLLSTLSRLLVLLAGLVFLATLLAALSRLLVLLAALVGILVLVLVHWDFL